jgi:simple sugar transport system ATP-binding protein
LVLQALREYNEQAGTTIVMVLVGNLRNFGRSAIASLLSRWQISGILPARSDSAEFGLLMLGASGEQVPICPVRS